MALTGVYIDDEAEQVAQSKGWTYKVGYQQGRDAAKYGRGNTNYFPQFTSAWWGWKQGNKDAEEASRKGW